MTTKRWILFIASFVLLTFVKAQNKKADSIAVAATFKNILASCKATVPEDPQIKTRGRFYKAAAYIVYRGSDKLRAWKDFVQYNNKEERDETDGICKKVNRTVNLEGSAYKIAKYFTEKESEGTWHVLIVSYTADGVEKKVAFAFLKIGKRFGLGDIDQNYK
jgi:hypothetical protein